MKPFPLLLLGLGGLSALACKAHQHDLAPGDEMVTIELTSGLR